MNVKENEESLYSKNLRLIAEYREGNQASGEELAEINQALVYKIAGKFTGRGVELDELVEVGTLGLVKAINSFDFSRECAFSTYAVPLIFGEIRRFLRDDGIIKVSRESKRLGAVINAERERRMAQGEDASLSRVAESVGVSVQDAAMAIFSVGSVRSLDESVFDDDDGTTLGAVTCEDGAVEREFDKLSLHLALEKLTGFERRLILLRYFRDLSQSKTAEILGLSQVKVSRMEKKILASLRNFMD